MKRLISILTLTVLLFFVCSCKHKPQNNDNIAFTDTDAGAKTADEDTDDIFTPESQAPKPQVPEPQAPEPQAPKPQVPEPQEIKYTVKHDYNYYLSISEEDATGMPLIQTVNSTQELSQVKDPLGSSPQIRYHERTDTTPYDYTKPVKNDSLIKIYDDAFFESKILVYIISEHHCYNAVFDISSVKSDGTIQIDVYVDKSEENYKAVNYFCDYIELDKEYAELDFKVKYNEISVDEPIETRAPLPEYPQSIDFKAKQFHVGMWINNGEIHYPNICIISTVEELNNYIEYDLKYHQYKGGGYIDCLESSNDKTIRFERETDNNKNRATPSYWKTTHINLLDYYDDEFFENNIICAVIYQSGSGYYDNQLRSVEPDGTLVTECYTTNVVTCDTRYNCILVELDKSCKSLPFKVKTNALSKAEYIWDK